jgi:transposase
MIAAAAGVKILVATKPVDFRRGADSLAALVREALGHDPFLCVERDYVAAGWREARFHGVARAGRHIITHFRAAAVPRPLP